MAQGYSTEEDQLIPWDQWNEDEFNDLDFGPELQAHYIPEADNTVVFAQRNYTACIEHPAPHTFDPEWICVEVSHREALARCTNCPGTIGAWMIVSDRDSKSNELSYDMLCDTCLVSKIYCPKFDFCNDHGWAKSFYYTRRPMSRTKKATQ